MAVTSVKAVVEAHRKLYADFTKQLEKATGKKPPAAELPTREIEREIGRVRGRLSAVQNARDRAIERFDTEIEQLTATLNSLEQRLKADQKNIKKAGGQAPKPPKGGTAPAKVAVDTIDGIGATRKKKLAGAGLGDAASLAAAKPEVVAEILGVPSDQAKAFIREAKKLAKG